MIEPQMAAFLMRYADSFLKPADSVAILQDDHKVSHAKLLLSQYKYTRVPVVDADRHYIGVVGISEILEFEGAHDFFYEKSRQTDISEIVNRKVATVQTDYELADVLQKLISEPFVPVLAGKEFTGIIVRQDILKAVNALLHTFGDEYDITKRNS